MVALGEELLLRSVLLHGLLQYGAVLAVLGSSVIFVLSHGINTALVIGIIAAGVTRRSGSISPVVLIHVVNNLAAYFIVLLLRLGTARWGQFEPSHRGHFNLS